MPATCDIGEMGSPRNLNNRIEGINRLRENAGEYFPSDH